MSSFGFGTPPIPFLPGLEPIIKKRIRQNLQPNHAAHAKSSIVVQNNKYSYSVKRGGRRMCVGGYSSCIPQVWMQMMISQSGGARSVVAKG